MKNTSDKIPNPPPVKHLSRRGKVVYHSAKFGQYVNPEPILSKRARKALDAKWNKAMAKELIHITRSLKGAR